MYPTKWKWKGLAVNARIRTAFWELLLGACHVVQIKVGFRFFCYRGKDTWKGSPGVCSEHVRKGEEKADTPVFCLSEGVGE